ncbi:nitroreductase family protein [Paenibacillus macerans]|uniref:nitroreductase family protein n=1 Tax=Paenibacillus macerans TaxID=44252 RepID=UPI002E222A3D|nr:nitroreductase family protein [Paenibacillus macerans]
MNLLRIDQELCRTCGLCSAICVDDVFAPARPGAYPDPVHEQNCISCGHCVAICPAEAISHNRLRREKTVAFEEKRPHVTPEEMELLLRSKRSIRHFKNTPVPRERIDKLLEIAQQAPSDTNSQDRRYIVVTDLRTLDELEERLIGYYKSLIFWMKGPVRKFLGLFTPHLMEELGKVLPDFKAMVRKHEQGEKPVFRGAPCVIFIYGSKGNLMGKDNCLIAQDYLMLQAETMGLGSCIIGYATGAPGTLAKFLNIPKGMQVYSAVTLGYPKYRSPRGVDRNDPVVRWI